MCYAVIRTTYLNKDKDVMLVETPEALDDKIAHLQKNDQVVTLSIYTLERRLARETIWAEQPASKE